MIQKVREMRPGYNNSARISASATISGGKLLYYRVLYWAYSVMGRFVTLAICNSTWTQRHIQHIWVAPSLVVYPPCNISRFAELPLARPAACIAVSVGQFRPEKDHELQIDAFALMLSQHPELTQARLQLIGSCRGLDDHARVSALRARAAKLGISPSVEFHLNVSFTELLSLLGRAQVGLHTMWNEHFGICVVELMAAGLLTIAHCSGGPKEDIVTPGRTGFLSTTVQEYADCIFSCFTKFDDYLVVRKAARRDTAKYSDEAFLRAFDSAVNRFL